MKEGWKEGLFKCFLSMNNCLDTINIITLYVPLMLSNWYKSLLSDPK